MRSYGNQSFAIRDRNAPHNISISLPRFNARIFDCTNGQRSNTHFVVFKSWLRLNMLVTRNLWRKLHVMNMFTIAAAKILKTRTKGQLLGQNRAEVLFIGRGNGGQISQHKNCARSLSNPKPMFLTVLELMTTSLHDKKKEVNLLAQNLCSSTFAMLFALQFTRACIFDIFC